MTPYRSKLRILIRATTILTLTVTATVNAWADKGDSKEKNEKAFVERLFRGPTTKATTYACFVRQYDSGHLASHPLQKVRAMKLLVTSQPASEVSGASYSFDLGVNLRRRRGVFNSNGNCAYKDQLQRPGSAASFYCYVECDGGGIDVALTNDDSVAEIRLDNIRIWQGPVPDDDASDQLAAGADDKLFRLHRADLETCRSLVADRGELAAMLGTRPQ